MHQGYDDRSRLEFVNYTLDYGISGSKVKHNYEYYFIYDSMGNLSTATLTWLSNVNASISYSYNDALWRMTGKDITFSDGTNEIEIETGYSFLPGTVGETGTQTSHLVGGYRSEIVGVENTGYTYTYDDNGNITDIKVNGVLQYKYYYDDLGQLIQENNKPLGKAYVWEYDKAGNIKLEKTYDYSTGEVGALLSTKTYTYGNSNWRDQLTNLNGTTISYDNVGHPLNYYSKDYNWGLTWNGRQLVSMSEDMDGQSLSFTYNDSGIRTSKVVDGVVHTYTLNGSQIISEEWSNKLIIYLYDESGSPIGFAYRTTSRAANTFYYYVYEKNLQGDIVAIYNTSGTKLVSYTYDAWGKVTMTTHVSLTGTNIGAMYNPIRYRGYYYDTETGLYYLNSRYYDPDTGRFLNADVYLNANGDMLGYNMYAYCSNNPINFTDPTGEWSKKTIGLVIAGLAVATVTAVIVSTGGGAILAGIGVSQAMIDSLIIAGIVSGTLAGGAVVAKQLLESDGEKLDLGEVWRETAKESIGTMLEMVLLKGGSALGTFLSNHKAGYEVGKAYVEVGIAYAKKRENIYGGLI